MDQAEPLTEDEQSALAVLARADGHALPARYRVEWVGPHAGHPTGPTMGKRVVWDQRADAALAGLLARGLASLTDAGFVVTAEGKALASDQKLRPGSPR